jgi:uncharacterized protein (TIGR02231 family)
MVELQTQIVEVTVYPDRARVTRRGTTALEPGTHKVEIPELPLALDPSSARAGGQFTASAGRGDARLLGVDVRKAFYQETPVAQVKELEDQLQTLEDQDKALADQAEALAVQGELARSVAEKSGEQIARGVARARIDVAQGGALMSFVAQELARAQEGIRQVTVQRRELAKQLDRLRNQLNSLRGSRGRERYTATIEVEVTAAGELAVDLIYVVSNAGWKPLYDVRLVEHAIELTYLGQVTQRTGEDWSDVALALSTARPSLAAVLPELKPWYINLYQPELEEKRVYRAAPATLTMAPPPPAAAPAPEMGMGLMAKAVPVEMEVVTASVDSAGASVTFRLPQKVSVPADGEPTKVTVATANLEPQLDYVTVPKLAEFAFRRATAKNACDLMLLPGQASLFVEGDYIGSTPFRLTAPGEEFELYLGVDDRVYIKRELKAREVDKKFLQDKRRLHYGYEIEARNLRADKIALEIHDQLPVPRHESIKAKLESSDPKPAEQTELNELTWKLGLEPGAKQFVRFDFSVEYPRDANVVGLT